MRKVVLIPAYEPDENLKILIQKLSKEDVFTVVVDDGSGDKYKNIFDSIQDNARVISYKSNRGKGYALKTGLNFIKNNFKGENYVVVTMDSDGQHTVEDAMKLYEYIEKNPNKLALGKRIRGKNTPIRSKLGNSITTAVYSMSTKAKIYDTQTGLRAFSNNLIDTMLEIDGDRYEYEMNVLLILPRMGIEIQEIEIQTIYIDKNANSHFNTIKDSVLIYKQIIKFSLSSISSFFIDYILYSILILLTQNILISNISARVVSSAVNYTINKKMVFKNNDSLYKSASQYFLLALIILALNTSILYVLVNVLGMNAYVSKILVEVLLFLLSWTVQKKVIFKSKGGKNVA